MATKRPSGGKRAVEAKHARRKADRERAAKGNYRKAEITGFRAAFVEGKSPVDVLDESIALLREALRQAADDPGMPPEQKREQIGRLAEKLGKLAEPKKIIEELGAELREAHDVIQGLKHAAQESARDPQGPAAASEH